MGGHEFSRPYQSLRCTMEAGGELVDIHRKSDSSSRFLSIPQSNADHFVLSYFRLLLLFAVCIIIHGLFIAKIFVFFRFSCSPPPVKTRDDRGGCQGSTTVAHLCRKPSLSETPE